MAERRVPRIRFKGFEEDWEQRKLGEISQSFSGGTPSVGIREYYGGEIPFIRSAEINNEETELFLTEKGLKESSAKIVDIGDILYALYGATSGEVSRAKIKGAINQAVLAITPDKEYDAEYLVTWLHKNKQRIIDTYLQGGQGNLSGNIVKNLMVRFPLTKEQYKIGRLFWIIDSLLSLHQRKLEKLKILKKAMLEKMFPKNGEKVPEIRFSGFADDWEQRKLGELADIVGGGTPSTSNPQYWDGDIDWYAPAEINEQVYVSSSQKKITKVGYENSSVKLLPVGTVLFTSRAGIGKTAILAREACTNQGFQSIIPHKQELDSYFIFSRSAELKQYGEIAGAGSTFVEVSGKQMSEMELMMPLTLNEQQAIGTYFRRLDQLLSLHQRKLEKLRQIKKSMLERMFV